MSERGLHYRAFISYSHADAAWGRRIHRGLETYALPKKLIGTTTERGDVPQRLSPIFRDREELSAGVDLSEQVQGALAASDALIVVCSPRAKASFWVGKEIETFRALYPNRPIFAALVDGEPAEAFPDALVRYGAREAEPIAADFRKTGDGARLAKLKLVAGLTGLKLDDLVQRDAQRQWRRVMTVTLVAGVAVLIMALLLVIALRAQSEAERQRAEAEGLVEYMLTDLRDRLKGVGRLDVMAAVNERAMGYYKTQATLGDMPPESLERRARILHAMGEDDEKRGDLGLALKKFEEAHRTTAAILAQKPDDTNAIFAHAQSEYWVGYAYFELNRKPTAMPFFERYRELAYRLELSDPTKPAWLKEVGYAEANLCAIALQAPPQPQRALNSCRKAVTPMELLLELQPSDPLVQSDLANSYAWLADANRSVGDEKAAAILREKQYALVLKAAQMEPRSIELKQNLMLAEISLAEQWQRAGNNFVSRKYIQRARKMANTLEKVDQDNKKWDEWQRRIENVAILIKGEKK